MRWDEAPEDRGRVKFAVPAASVEGYGGRAVDGRALHSTAGYRFPDPDGDLWWVIFQPGPAPGTDGRHSPGDILACNDSDGDTVQVLVLAAGVREDDAEAAFRAHPPSSLADAARVAAAVSRRGPTGAG